MTTLVQRGSSRGTRQDVRDPSPDPSTDPSTPQFTSHFNASDALMWSIEKDPCLRSTIVAVSLLDRKPDWHRLGLRIADACELIPRLRQRVVGTPLHLGPPRWQLDEYFDINYHLRRTVAPEPGDLRSVLDIAGLMAMTAFDKDRPLWEFTLVEGLTDGRAAFIQKVHHSFTDGVGGLKLAQLLLDEKRNPARRDTAPRSADQPRVSGLTSAAESLAADVRAAAIASLRGAHALPGVAARAVTNPGGPLTTLTRELRSIGKLLAPVSKPLSPIMADRGLSRRLDSFDVALDSMLAAAHAANSTLNDAFLASVAGGMRRYHDRHDAPVGALRVTMPINLRRPGDPPGSNRFTPARFKLPVSTVDAGDRMRELGQLARDWRNEPSVKRTGVVANVLNRLPAFAATSLLGSMLKAIDFVATNLPGLKHRAYLAGAEVVREYAFAPPSGAAFSVSLMSHVDQCCVGINADISAVPDPEVLTTCLREGFDEVLTVGRKP
ncbi:MAG: WS/DGAT domain-containing protein [Actinomycetota bacterium]|nr:WS/DGAT domain-containing protein [Actinomycetota bacterium]